MHDTRNGTFGTLLRRHREAAGLTQEDLALRAGLSANGVSQLERGERRRPYPHTVRALSEALDLPEGERASLLAAVPRRATSPTAGPEQSLPTPSTPLLGRERELGEVGGLLEEVRLLTLTGTGGVGKTRLAVEAAWAALAAGIFPDGVAFVALASLGDAGFVVPAVIRSLGFEETAARTPRQDLSAYLREKRMLLVLDNFEHLLRAAPEVAALIESCPDLTVLATSRAPLRVRGEQEYPVRPLALPRSTVSSALEEVAGSPSGRLFVERARAVSPVFGLDRNNAATVAAICRRLAGLPLALELAAAKARFLSPWDLLTRLDEALLAGGSRDLPPRQRTMRATLDWSHDLLTEAEKALFRRLSVFAGGFTLEAAEAVGSQTDAAGKIGAGPVVELLGTLVEQSLVAARPGGDGGGARYGMLEPVRQYGLELLEHGDDDADDVRIRHARYYLALAERAATELEGARQATWSQRLEEEHDNLRVALSGAIGREEDGLGLRLAGNLGEFWYTRGYAREGRRWLEAALTKGAGAQEASARSRALTWATTMAWTQGDLERATALGEEGLSLARDMGDPSNIATALFAVGRAALFADRLGRASELIEEAVSLQRALGDPASLARSLMLLGWVTEARGDHGRAMALREEALALSRKAEDDFTTVYLWALGAFAALGLGDYRRARELGKEGLELSRQRNLGRHTAVHLHVLASLESQQGHQIRSARLTGAAEAMYRGIDNVFSSVEGRLFGPYAAAARARLGDTAWEAARDEGREMTPEQAVAYALEGDCAPPAQT